GGQKAIAAVRAELPGSEQSLFAGLWPAGFGNCPTEFDEIIYVEANDDKTWLWISQTEYFETYEKISEVLLRLPKANFVRVHRSYAISLNHFKQIISVTGSKDKRIQLAGTDTGIPIGAKDKYPLFEQWLGENAIRGKKVSIIARGE